MKSVGVSGLEVGGDPVGLHSVCGQGVCLNAATSGLQILQSTAKQCVCVRVCVCVPETLTSIGCATLGKLKISLFIRDFLSLFLTFTVCV